MNEEITQEIYFQKGYDKGFSDAQENLAKEFDKCYERGFKAGIESCENKPLEDEGNLKNETH